MKEIERKSRTAWKGLKFASVGFELVISILLGFFGGRWIDGKAGTWPTFAIIGLLLGIVAGMRGLYRAAKEAEREMERELGEDG